MAASNSTSHPSFLIYPTLSREYIWKIVASESNRTISRHKLLENAVQKAERLNIEAFLAEMPRRTGCDCNLLSQYGRTCQEHPTVTLDEDFAVTTDLNKMEFELCADCARDFIKGSL